MENENNNLMVFEGHNVEVFEWEGKVLFNPYNVGECLELTDSAVRMAIAKMSEKQVVKLKNSDVHDMNFRKLNNTGENFLTESGVLALVSKSVNCSDYKKAKVIETLFPNKYVLYLDYRNEIKFIDKLEQSLKPFGIVEGIRQYRVFNYRIDYYIPNLNVAIEYDENNHKNYTYSQQDGRQKEIEDKLKCNFIRVSDKNSDEYNIGLVIKNILKLKGEMISGQ